MERHGMIQVYIGDGKGKTTAAVGLTIRALGCNLKVLFAQFLKSGQTGEKIILETFQDKLLFFRPKQRHQQFLWEMTAEELAWTKEDIELGWEILKSEIFSGKWDIVVLDEILDCIQNHLLSEEEILKTVKERPEKVEIVITGHQAPQSFYEIADYISQIDAVKHPFNKGVPARRGIEF